MQIKMQKRVVSGILGAVLLFIVLLAGEVIINIALAAVAVLALSEAFSACGLTKKTSVIIIGLVFCPILTFTYKSHQDFLIFLFIAVLFAVYMLFKGKISLGDIATTFFLTTYIGVFLGYIMSVRVMPNGKFLVWFIFVCAFLTDTFAMLGGLLYGKHKLSPVLSPKKTIEGAIIGVLGSTAGLVAYCFILKYLFNFNPNFLSAVILGILASVVAQFGDLAASCIKRQYHVKDYGNIMPGHGGILDRIDSVIFTAPLVYFFINLLPII